MRINKNSIMYLALSRVIGKLRKPSSLFGNVRYFSETSRIASGSCRKSSRKFAQSSKYLIGYFIPAKSFGSPDKPQNVKNNRNFSLLVTYNREILLLPLEKVHISSPSAVYYSLLENTLDELKALLLSS